MEGVPRGNPGTRFSAYGESEFSESEIAVRRGVMVNTLGLVGDLDDVELVELVERAFDITFSPREMEQILTVGEFYDLLLTKIPPNGADRQCASAMAFYRLRSALRRLGYGDGLTGASDMHVLEQEGRRPTSGNLKPSAVCICRSWRSRQQAAQRLSASLPRL
jgi:hypothetical protein